MAFLPSWLSASVVTSQEGLVSMSFSRRSFLVATGAALSTAPVWNRTLAAAQTPDASVDPLFAPRQLGNPNAKVVVEEWFSLTCIHCAHFAENTFPQVKTNLIDTGKIRYVFHDFPTDQTATIAAMVARALPVDRYEPSAPRCCPASTAGPMTAKPTR
nr:thioredoxin domain-containing protein [Acetobacter papayae]